MPRKSRPAPESPAPAPRKRTRKVAPTLPTLADLVQAAVAGLPFAFGAAPTDANLFPNLPDLPCAEVPDGSGVGDLVRAGIAEQIAADRAAGLSGTDLRTKYSGIGCPTDSGLSGPLRRKVLRQFGHGSVVARSYVQYSDGMPRAGSAHARAHGPHAAQRVAAALDALASEQTEATDFRAQGQALRSAGQSVPRDAGKRADAFRALRRDALAQSAAQR